ncbi:unnamed protein product [Cylindrotheca closterium]|uniref:ELMO domain-containing protein n=1 Tax=Cylindrotheca closterium TaxID=2856 RepID=A0AAD2CNB9_9STRA|nr:unnamed protein product [Cylindrotheca closterium]
MTDRSQENSSQGLLRKTGFFAKTFAADAGNVIGNIGSAAFQSITTRKYTLPDKSVASQVLMYRQLLHTKCRPGLKLTRPYQGTAAQKAVMHMPWWEEGIEQTEKMTISYDNLITRLWLNGAIIPFQESSTESVDTLIDEDGLPPIPHKYWVDRLGFQQPDPVTDFRSGGVLSLAMMVHMVESCPKICERLFSGDASVLPFGITCINVTDMIAKFLMLAKSTDRMDALLSQKPFWKMFADPNAILAVQELAMSMLCDVVVEVSMERKIPSLARQHSTSMHGDSSSEVSVFDFALITERTETRVRDDLLGAGPKTVEEVHAIAGRLRVKYKVQLEKRIERARQQEEHANGGTAPAPQMKDVVGKAAGLAGGIAVGAAGVAGGLVSRFQGGGKEEGSVPVAEEEAPPPIAEESSPTMGFATPPQEDESKDVVVEEVEGDWLGSDNPPVAEPATEPVTDDFAKFSIEDDDEDIM